MVVADIPLTKSIDATDDLVIGRCQHFWFEVKILLLLSMNA
jgi:hypothetical protein